jgi:hypothetical protein
MQQNLPVRRAAQNLVKRLLKTFCDAAWVWVPFAPEMVSSGEEDMSEHKQTSRGNEHLATALLKSSEHVLYRN